MVNKEFLLNNISNVDHLTIECNCCKKGVKIFDKTKYFESETEFSKKEFSKEVNGYQTRIHRRFSAGYICSNPDCKDISIIIGDKNSILKFETIEYQGELIEAPTYHDKILIYDIIPTFNLFNLANYSFNTESEEILNELNDIFSVFWRNTDCCGMKIRTFIEVLMNDNDIARTLTDKNGNKKFYTLHKRIELFEVKYPNEELKDILLNLKDSGNIGSHSGQNLSREELIIMLEIIESILNQLYTDNRKKLISLNNELKNIQKLYKA